MPVLVCKHPAPSFPPCWPPMGPSKPLIKYGFALQNIKNLVTFACWSTLSAGAVLVFCRKGRQEAAVTSFLLFYSHAVGNFVNGMLAPLGGQADGGYGDGCLHTGNVVHVSLIGAALAAPSIPLNFFLFIDAQRASKSSMKFFFFLFCYRRFFGGLKYWRAAQSHSKVWLVRRRPEQ